MNNILELPQMSGHFLTKRQQELLIAYSEQLEKSKEAYDKLMDDLMFINPYAFHTRKTLNSRRFLHCPHTTIPFLVCYRK